MSQSKTDPTPKQIIQILTYMEGNHDLFFGTWKAHGVKRSAQTAAWDALLAFCHDE